MGGDIWPLWATGPFWNPWCPQDAESSVLEEIVFVLQSWASRARTFGAGSAQGFEGSAWYGCAETEHPLGEVYRAQDDSGRQGNIPTG